MYDVKCNVLRTLIYVTVHAKTLRKSANFFVELRADFPSPTYILHLLQISCGYIARSVAEIRLFLDRFDGHIYFLTELNIEYAIGDKIRI